MTFSFIIFISFYLIVLSEEKLPHDATPDKEKDVLINSDDDELNQALLLIDILKSDYLQLLRQSSENVTATVEQSTCAATTGLDNERSGSRSTRNESVENLTTTVSVSVSRDDSYKTASNKSAPWNSPMVHAAPLFPWRWSDLGTTRVYNYTMPLYHTRRPPRQRQFPRIAPWRHFFPDYYLYDVYPRRFYKNVGTYLRTPTTNKRLETLAPTTTTAVHTTATTESPRKSTKNTKSTTLTASSKATSKSLRTTKRRPSTRTLRTSKKHTFRKKTSKMNTKNPVEAEIASELLQEFKLINVIPKPTRAKTPNIDSTSTE